MPLSRHNPVSNGGWKGKKVAWAPPALSSPTVELPPTTTFKKYEALEAGKDLELKLPSPSRNNQLEIKNWRRVRIIGGKLVGSTGTSMLRANGIEQSVFLEGLVLDANQWITDILNIGGTGAESPATPTFAPDVYLQNILGKGIKGTDATNHSDLVQPQKPMGNLCIDKMTGYTSYQGLFLSNQFPITSIRISRANFRYELGISEEQEFSYPLWLRASNQTVVPTYLENVWVDPKPGQKLVKSAVWPKEGEVNGSGEAVGAIPLFNSEGEEIGCYWPPAAGIYGIVWKGVPPGGDFVKESEVGPGYVPAGYGVGAPGFIG